MKRRIKVAAIQMNIIPGDIKANLKKVSELAEKALGQGKLDLIVFPEDCITGPIPYNLDLAQSENSPSINFFRKLSIKYKVHIVCGSFIEKIKDDYFNTSLLINDEGKTLLKYRKNNLWHPERNYLTPGREIFVAKTNIGTIGIIICWDLAFPETSRKLAKMGAEIICCPSYWTKADSGRLVRKYGEALEATFVNTICPARAIENETLFIYANGAGEGRIPLKTKVWHSPQIGQSQICAPILGTVIRIVDNREGFVSYEYDRQIGKEAEKVYKIRRDIIK